MNPSFLRRISLSSSQLILCSLLCLPSALSAAEASAPAAAPATSQATPARPQGFFPETVFPELAPVLQKAAAQSPALLEARYRTLEARGQSVSANAALLPSVRASAFAGGGSRMDDNFSRNSFIAPVQSELTVSWALYHWGAQQDSSRMGKFRRAIAEGRLAEGYAGLLQEVRNRWLELLIAEECIRLQESIVREEEGRLKRLEQAGSAAALELEELRLGLAEAREELERQGAVLTDLRERFVLLADLSEAPAFGEESAQRLLELDAGSAQAVWNAPEATRLQRPVPLTVANLQHELEAEKLQGRIIRSKGLPLLNLVAGVRQDQADYVHNIQQKDSAGNVTGEKTSIRRNAFRATAFGGLQVDWNIFDGYLIRGQRMESRARQRRLTRQIEAARQQSEHELKSLRRQLELDWQRVQNRDGRFQFLKRRCEVARDEQTRGTLTPADQESLRREFGMARIKALQARAEFLMRLAQLSSLYGLDTAIPASHASFFDPAFRREG